MTSFDDLIDRFLRRIEKDSDFFVHYNLSAKESQKLVIEQAKGYIPDAIYLLCSRCTPDINMYNYDEDMEEFNFDLTPFEIGMLSSLMYQVYLERQEALLGAFKIRMSPSDLKTFSPANERKSFEDLVERVKKENEVTISKYESMDRLTGKHKQLDFSVVEN